MNLYNPKLHIRLRSANLPGPDSLFFGEVSEKALQTAAQITAGYTKAAAKSLSKVCIFTGQDVREIEVVVPEPGTFHPLLIQTP